MNNGPLRNRLDLLVNPNEFPFWQILLELGISEDKKSDLESVLFLLTDRLSGKNFVVIRDDEITGELIDKLANDSHDSVDRIISYSTISRFPDALAKNSLPLWEESLSIISSVLEISDEDTIKKILIAMREQSMFKQLINHLLPTPPTDA